jgi:hypothetical protein
VSSGERALDAVKLTVATHANKFEPKLSPFQVIRIFHFHFGSRTIFARSRQLHAVI